MKQLSCGLSPWEYGNYIRTGVSSCKKLSACCINFVSEKLTAMMFLYAAFVLLFLLSFGMLMQPLHQKMTDLNTPDPERAAPH